MNRTSEIIRKTKETNVRVAINLDDCDVRAEWLAVP